MSLIPVEIKDGIAFKNVLIFFVNVNGFFNLKMNQIIACGSS